jgi:hypothetical protein
MGYLRSGRGLVIALCASYPVAAGQSAIAHFKLTRAARRALKQRKRLKATVTITTVHGGRSTKRTEKVTLR